MKTRESISEYNKKYFARPEVILRAKIRNAQRRDKRKAYKKTKAGREAQLRYARKKYIRDKRTGRDLEKRYGITLLDYQKFLENQNGGCAICGLRVEYKLHVDHCHKTKKVRGLLCGNCNRGLGLMRDNIENLLKAVEYLKKS